jgi:SM-20-related protein
MAAVSRPGFPDDPEIERIAEALAGPGWCLSEGFLTPAQQAGIVAECQARWLEGEFRQARVGVGGTLALRPEVRRDHVHWLDAGQPAEGAVAAYLDRMEALRLAVNRRLYLGLFEYEGHFAVYPPGAFYRRHLDQFDGVQYRQVTCVLYLNDAWGPDDGGELRLFLEQGHLDIRPSGGTLVTFLSALFEHEVRPTRRQRLSVTGWLRQRAAALP